MLENTEAGKDSGRDRWFDLLRGICIVCVVLGHSIAYEERLRFVENLIYSFHMPLLFWISAYVEERSFRAKNKPLTQVFFKRFRSLLIPFWCWVIIGYILSSVSTLRLSGVEAIDGRELLASLSGFSGSGPWFLFVLFELKVIHLLYWKLTGEKSGIIKSGAILFGLMVIVAVLAVVTGHVALRYAISFSIPYFAGSYMAQFPQLEALCKQRLVAISAGVLYCGLFLFYDSNAVQWTNQIVRIVLSLCVIVVLNFFRTTENKEKNICGYLAWIGCNSIAVYLIHGYFQPVVVPLIAAVKYAVPAFFVAVLIALLESTLWSFVKWAMDRWIKPVSVVLFGR